MQRGEAEFGSKPDQGGQEQGSGQRAAKVGGVDYMVRPIKGYAGILLASKFQGESKPEDFDASEFIENTNLLISTIFTKSDAAKIHARLLDAEDDLDITEIMEKFGELVEQSSGTPTT